MEQPFYESYETARPDERSGRDLSAAFGIGLGLALGVAFQVVIFLGLRSLWAQLFG